MKLLKDITLHLVDINEDVCKAFEKHFGHYENVTIWHCPFQELSSYDVMVSPANSFGQMDGGIDYYITEFFGQQLMDRVQQYIIANYAGEQPVGTSFIIPTMDVKHPLLAHTPTMRVPTSIVGTDNPYRAMKAMLLEVENYNRSHSKPIKSIACPGLGTLIGKMDPDVAVGQMALAYKHMLDPIKQINWKVAWNRHLEIEHSKKLAD